MTATNKTTTGENPASLPLTGTELIRGVQSGGNVKFTAQDVANLSSLPLTTKGDLVVYGTSPTRLPVGADTTALIADSTQATGTKWGDPTAPLTASLANTSDLTKGAGQVGFLYSLVYAGNTVGAWLKGLSTSSGAGFVGWINQGTGAVLRTVLAVLRGRVRIRDFGAVCDGVTDDTAAIQAAIVFAAQLYPSNSWFDRTYQLVGVGAPRMVDFEGATCKVAGKILVPTGVVLNGGQCTLIGTGNTVTDNICFESAYFNAGTITSNIGTSNESQVLQGVRIREFRFFSFKLALNMFDACEGCEFADLDFGSCYQSGYFDRCFYARFRNLHSNENVALAASTLPALDFRDFVNVEALDTVAVHARILGIQFSGGVNGLAPKNLSVESCTTGIKFLGQVGPMNIDGAYFESITGTALDFTDNSGHTVTIDNSFFNGCGTAIAGINMFSGRIGAGNVYQSCTNNVVFSDNGSYITVAIPATNVLDSGSTVPSVPAGFSLGPNVDVVYPVTVISAGSSTAQVRSKSLLNNFAELPYFGQAGHVTNQVAFCAASHTGTTTATVNIDTKITYDVYLRWMFYLKIVDSGGNTFVWGDVWGTNVNPVNAGGKTITASNNGGYFRLTISTFNTPIDAQCEGIVRIV